MIEPSWVFKKTNIAFETDSLFYIIVETPNPQDEEKKREFLRNSIEQAERFTKQSGMRVLDYSIEPKKNKGMLVAVGFEIEKKRAVDASGRDGGNISLGNLLAFRNKLREK